MVLPTERDLLDETLGSVYITMVGVYEYGVYLVSPTNIATHREGF